MNYGLIVLKGSIAALGGKLDQTDFSSIWTAHDTVCLLWLETFLLLAHSVQQEPQCSWGTIAISVIAGSGVHSREVFLPPVTCRT